MWPVCWCAWLVKKCLQIKSKPSHFFSPLLFYPFCSHNVLNSSVIRVWGSKHYTVCSHNVLNPSVIRVWGSKHYTVCSHNVLNPTVIPVWGSKHYTVCSHNVLNPTVISVWGSKHYTVGFCFVWCMQQLSLDRRKKKLFVCAAGNSIGESDQYYSWEVGPHHSECHWHPDRWPKGVYLL